MKLLIMQYPPASRHF